MQAYSNNYINKKKLTWKKLQDTGTVTNAK
jgi:hypothetical protein